MTEIIEIFQECNDHIENNERSKNNIDHDIFSDQFQYDDNNANSDGTNRHK